jgi:endonuclease/exonuclease/phosphatase family metal-dependent hydrolase
MSYNTWSRNTDATRIAAVVLRYRPDVLLLQEIPADVLLRLTDALQELYDGSPRPKSSMIPRSCRRS